MSQDVFFCLCPYEVKNTEMFRSTINIITIDTFAVEVIENLSFH